MLGSGTNIANIGYDGPVQAIDQADATIHGGKQQRAQIGGELSAGEPGANRETG